DSPGYIINPYSNIVVKGFRESEDEVAAFKFVEKSKSYSTEMKGTTINNGVIGCMIFSEYHPPIQKIMFDPLTPYGQPAPWDPNPFENLGTWCGNTNQVTLNDSTPSINASLRSFDLGSGWGDSITDKVEYTSF